MSVFPTVFPGHYENNGENQKLTCPMDQPDLKCYWEMVEYLKIGDGCQVDRLFTYLPGVGGTNTL